VPARWGETLKRRRLQRGWTQQALADRAGVARNTIARLETGNRRPSFEMLERLARAFRLSLPDLLR
jgi:transcriptional regulator with XRE-family HTH domain